MNNSKDFILCNYLKNFISKKEDYTKYFESNDLEYIYKTLIHYEEKNSSYRDEWGNWDIQFCNNNHDTPFLDEFVLKKLKNQKKQNIWPKNAQFAVHLSHDFDRFTLYSPRNQIRRELKTFMNGNLRSKFISILRIVKDTIKQLIYFKQDELWHYENWFNLEKRHNVKSTNYIYIHPKIRDCEIEDCDYKVSDKILLNEKEITIRDFIIKIRNLGHEIGLHGSFKTYNSSNLFLEQKKQLEKIISDKINCTRQHYLHFKWNDTINIHGLNDIQCDSSLGFNTGIGFRAGTSYPYLIETNDNKFVLEIPLIIMDSALRISCGNDLNKMYSKSISLIEKVENCGGCITLNFHPDYINTHLFKLYEMLLEYLSKKNCVFLNTNEIYESCVE